MPPDTGLRQAPPASHGAGAVPDLSEVSAAKVAGVTRFSTGAVVQALRHLNGRMLRRLHPQRYTVVCVALITVVVTLIEPLLRGQWSAPYLQPLAWLSMAPALAAVLGDPTARIPANLRAIGIRWSGLAAGAWIVILQLLRLFSNDSWIPIAMVVGCGAMLCAMLGDPAGKQAKPRRRKSSAARRVTGTNSRN